MKKLNFFGKRLLSVAKRLLSVAEVWLPSVAEVRLPSVAGVLLLATMMCAPFTASAQVTIGSGDLPQATLDIVGAAAETGKAFRMTDGNQADSKVLTVVGDNGIATWKNAGLTILQATEPQPTTPKSVLIKDYPTTSTIFVDTDAYVDLAPGKYMIVTYMPVFFNFSISAFESMNYRVLLTKDGVTGASSISIAVPGPQRANFMQRHITMFTLNISSNTATTRYYVGYSDFIYSDATGAHVTTTHPNAATNGASFIRRDVGGYVYAIPMTQ